MTRLLHQKGRTGALLLMAIGAVLFGCLVCLAGSAAEVSALSTAAAATIGTQPMGTPPDGIAPNGTPPGGMVSNMTPPNGAASGGNPPGGSAGSASYDLSGAYTVDGTTASETGKTFTSSTDDVSAIYVTNGGSLTLLSPAISTTGGTSSNDASSFFGLNAAVLADENSTVFITGGSIATTGTGANGAFPSGSGASISLSNVTITATGGGGHGVMASGGGTLTLNDTDITTSGANGAPIATDRGGGTVTVTGGTVVASGIDSPGIYSTGVITVNGATVAAAGSEAAVIEGKNSIALTNTDLVGSKGTRDRGIMIYQSMSGDADVGQGTFTMTSGSYDWTSTSGPAFYVTNTKATITLSGVKVTSTAEELLNASAGDWGTAGSNGGSVVFTADSEALTGSIVSDEISSITALLRNYTTLSGAIDSAALSLDATSTWTVTGDSALTTLTDTVGISGSKITNIVGNGHTVTYDATLTSNSALGGKTYTLANGGSLTPATATTSGSNGTASPSSNSTGGSEAYTGSSGGAASGTVAATTSATEIVTGTATPATSGATATAEFPTDAAGTAAAAQTASADTTVPGTATTTAGAATPVAGFDTLPIVIGALAFGAYVLSSRRG
jgi:hypothetical protein